MTGLRRGVLSVLLCALSGAGCNDCNGAPGKTYYQRNIEPILTQKCAGNTSGCHTPNLGDPYKFVAGNFDVSSFESVQKRRDVLNRFGPYPQPLLLIKAIAPELPDPLKQSRLQFQYGLDPTDPTGKTPAFRDIEVLHAGGAILELNSDAYFTLQTWLENGATENGLKPPTPAQTGNGTCSTQIPAGFSAAPFMMNPKYAAGFDKFKNDVMPILKDHGCTSSNCHGAPQSDFYITCGDDDNQLAFNFTQAWSFVNNPVDDSQILRVPLAVTAGGRGHTGGDQFSDTNDGDYTTLRDWAQSVDLLDFAGPDTGKQFFQQHVQPILIARGCQFEACHSPAATNDFKLRSGTQGFLSAVALEKNYELLRNEFMALEFPDSRRGRAVAKAINIDDLRTTTVGGIAHRGGPVLDTPSSGTCSNAATKTCYANTDCPGGTCNALPSDPALCPPYNAASTPPPTPFCTIQAWVDIERTNAGLTWPATLPLVYVDQASGRTGGRLDFFASAQTGQADLRTVDVNVGPFGQVGTVAGTPATLLGDASCAAITDVQGPEVALDGDHVAFGGRVSTGNWDIYTTKISGGPCVKVTNGEGHNFDPVWSPDGAYLVFASTRGKGGQQVEARTQPRPQSDIWRIPVNLTTGAASGPAEQVTVLSNSEVEPQFMREGRITMSTEKASDGFYQVSGRRINWDLTDYHPLLAQRAMSPYPSPTDLTTMNPSVGFSVATDIREGTDGSFLLIASNSTNGAPPGDGGAGAIGIFNRSIGPIETGRTDPGYLQSFREVGQGAHYRNPTTAPDGRILASYAASGTAWQLVLVDPRTSAQTSLNVPSVHGALVDAVFAYKSPARLEYLNRRQLVFGGSADTGGDTAHAIVHMPDAPMVFTMFTGNLRRGRPVDAFRKAKYLAVYSEGMCPAGSCPRTTNGIYQSRQLLGKAQLQDDGSVKVRLPAQTGLIFELQDDSGMPVVTMKEEHQLGPGEQISMGVRQNIQNTRGDTVRLFDAVCGGCHGSVTGEETDVAVTADALTGASVSLSQGMSPQDPN